MGYLLRKDYYENKEYIFVYIVQWIDNIWTIIPYNQNIGLV